MCRFSFGFLPCYLFACIFLLLIVGCTLPIVFCFFSRLLSQPKVNVEVNHPNDNSISSTTISTDTTGIVSSSLTPSHHSNHHCTTHTHEEPMETLINTIIPKRSPLFPMIGYSMINQPEYLHQTFCITEQQDTLPSLSISSPRTLFSRTPSSQKRSINNMSMITASQQCKAACSTGHNLFMLAVSMYEEHYPEQYIPLNQMTRIPYGKCLLKKSQTDNAEKLMVSWKTNSATVNMVIHVNFLLPLYILF